MNPLFGIVTPVVVPVTQPTPVDVQSGWGGVPATGGPSGDALLLESGDYLLLESGDYLLLE